MRGSDERSGELFSYVDLEKRVRLDHPLRAIQVLTDSALETLSGDFAALYSGLGRPSIAPRCCCGRCCCRRSTRYARNVS